MEYCCECPQYPCEKYEKIGEYDSFITARRQKADMEKLRDIGAERYNAEQGEKVQLLEYLLSSCNDGRRKTLFCLAVNLLELSDVQSVVDQLMASDLPTVKERAVYAASLFPRKMPMKKIRVKTLSLGVLVPDKFYELAKQNADMYLFDPYDVERKYGTPFSYVDITAQYDNLVNDP